MKTSLQAGLAGKRSFHVGRDATIGFLGEDSVGTRVEIDHLAPTLEGAEVAIEVRLAELNGRAATFDVQAFENGKPIGKGRHGRFIVDVAKTKERLKQKKK